jgi:NAD(P)-dependent dehydrogenase (short-subunit alcohol dehydrogenase family)
MAPLNRTSVALVTASSAGLGAATAKALAATGVRVVINYNSNQEKADAVLKELGTLQPTSEKDQTPRCHAIRADVSQRSSLINLVEETMKVMGRLDLVVSNHGWTKLRNFSDLDDNVEESDWDKCFNMNVKSHLWLFHAAKKHLEESEGSFITTASLAGVVPSGSSMVFYSVCLKLTRLTCKGVLGNKSCPDTPSEISGKNLWPAYSGQLGFPRALTYRLGPPIPAVENRF